MMQKVSPKLQPIITQTGSDAVYFGWNRKTVETDLRSTYRLNLLKLHAAFTAMSLHSFSLLRPLLAGAVLVFWGLGCDHGFAPPPPPEMGTIQGTITYLNPFPANPPVFELRFVAFRFVPGDTSDFFRLNEFVATQDLWLNNVAGEEFTIENVAEGEFLYSGVAQRFGPLPLNWLILGLYTDTGGRFEVTAGQTTHVNIVVDFNNLPTFPPDGN